MNSSQLTARIQSYINVTSGDAEALKLALYKNGPVAVGIDASHRSFVFYSHGVYYEPACGKFPSFWCANLLQQQLCSSLKPTSFIFQVTRLMIWIMPFLQ